MPRPKYPDALETKPTLGTFTQDGFTPIGATAPGPDPDVPSPADPPNLTAPTDPIEAADVLLRITDFLEWLLQQRPRHKLGRRISYTDNVICRYLRDHLKGTWVTVAGDVYGEDARLSTQLPDYAERLISHLSNSPSDDPQVTQHEVLVALVTSLVAAIPDDGVPF